MGDQKIYENGLLLGVFFQDSNNETDHLYVSFNGTTFKKIGVPYATADKAPTGPNRKSFRDPGMMDYDGKFWILNGDLVEAYDTQKRAMVNHYQPKWGVSEDLTKWSNVLSGNFAGADNNPISLNINGQFPYNSNGQLNNTKFEAWAPDVFVDKDTNNKENIYMLLSAGFWGESHEKDFEGVDDGFSANERDVMKQYLIKIKKLSYQGENKLQADYEWVKMINFPENDERLKADERKIRRGGKEDRIDI